MNFIEKLHKAISTAENRKEKLLIDAQIMNKLKRDGMMDKEEGMAYFDFLIKEKDGMVIALVDDLTVEEEIKRIYRVSKGDKFDAYTGIALCLFEFTTGLTYQDLRRVFDSFMPAKAKVDPALEFIKKYVSETLFSKEEIDRVIKESGVPSKDGGIRVGISIDGAINIAH